MPSPGTSRLRPLFSRAWIIVLVAAIGFLLWCQWARVQRAEYVTGIAQEPRDPAPASPTGYPGGTRQLIVPEHILESFGVVAQTQQMLAGDTWRLRHVEYDNAPQGRTLWRESLYRWYLGALALVDHWSTAKPLGQAVERATYYADPLLQVLLLIVTTLFLARQFGGAAASVGALAMVALFPFGAGFLPAVPEDFVLLLILGPWSILPLLAGAKAPAPKQARWFVLAGVVGGIGLWISVPMAVPLLAGIGVGALIAAFVQRPPRRAVSPDEAENSETPLVGVAATSPRAGSPSQEGQGGAAASRRADTRSSARQTVAHAAESASLRPIGTPSGVPPHLWRAWGLAGAVTVLACVLIEYFPSHLAHWELRVVHPLYGLAWLGAAELLYRLIVLVQRTRLRWRLVDFATVLLAVVAVAAVPAAMWKTGNLGFLAPDVLSFRLTKQSDGIMAPNFTAWLLAGGFSVALIATLLPVVTVLAAIVAILRRQSTSVTAAVASSDSAASDSGAGNERIALAIALGPVLVAATLAYFHLRWWQMFDGALLALLVVLTSLAFTRGARMWRWGWSGLLAAIFVLGITQVLPKRGAQTNVLTVPEVEGLVERDLAQWLAVHNNAPGGPVVLAPPSVTSSLCFYGGLRGLGTLDWENKEGLSVALRMVISTSREEALALIRKRGVTHIVIPSWDDFFASYMGPASVQTGELFFASIDRWSLPSWLRPVPYPLPNIPGFEANSVKVFEVVDDQNEPVAASRLAEYFIEMGQVDNAKLSDQLLRRYPADFGTWVARGQLYAALGDAKEFGVVLDTLLKRLATGGDKFLPWDRRVSLAIVLARGQRMDLAKVQVERALKDINAARVHTLTPYSLYHFLGLTRAFGLPIADPAVRELALRLLPPDLRQRVQ